MSIILKILEKMYKRQNITVNKQVGIFYFSVGERLTAKLPTKIQCLGNYLNHPRLA